MSKKNCMIIKWKKKETTAGRISVYRFVPRAEIKGIFGDSNARDIRLKRTKKTVCGCCGKIHWSQYDKKERRVRDLSCGDARIYLEVEVRRVLCRKCGKVKQEKLEWLADNPLLHEAICLFCGTEVQDYDRKGCGEGFQAGLGYGEDIRQRE
ncbi:MAG: transposase family protein [Planctomycetia bacterium]|nr:transposase family protein [Planctomycetia bacterium]